MLPLGVLTHAAVPHTPGHNTWWYIGIGIGFAIVAVVVVIAASILALAARIGAQAREGIARMTDVRDVTQPVWELQKTNLELTAIWRAAESARQSLAAAGVLSRR
jgi:hypothetical protein